MKKNDGAVRARQRSFRNHASWGSIAVLGAGIAAVSALATAALSPPPIPSDLAPPAAPGTVPVTVEEFNDAVDVEIVPTVAPVVHLIAPSAGVLTDVTCAPDLRVSSGTSPAAIDGQRILALHTSVPLWRDLIPGSTRGPDVTALKRELERLGREPGSGDTFDRRTARELTDVARHAGVEPPTGTVLGKSQLMWLPQTDAAVAECLAPLGSRVSADSALMTLRQEITSARLKVMPHDVIEGTRRVKVDGAELAVDEEGQVDPASLPTLAGSEAFRIWLMSDGEVAVHGRYGLERPLDVWIVPPSAVLTSLAGSCVIGGERAIPVEVVASRLGQSLLVADRPPPGSVTLSPREQRCD